MKSGVQGNGLEPTVEKITAALRLCAVDEPAETYPCEQCYLYPYSQDGRMSTGRTCFEHLALDTCQLINRLNDFDKAQSKIALERCQRAEAQLAESQRMARAAVEDLTGTGACFTCKHFRRNGGDCFGAGRCRLDGIEIWPCNEPGVYRAEVPDDGRQTYEWRGPQGAGEGNDNG